MCFATFIAVTRQGNNKMDSLFDVTAHILLDEQWRNTLTNAYHLVARIQLQYKFRSAKSKCEDDQ